MPPRVTYWTGVWDPRREALSKQIVALRELSGGRAPVVSFAPAQRSRLLARERIVRLSSRRWLTLRAVAACMEKRGEVTHVFGGIDEWHLLRAVGRRPVVFTVAIPGSQPARQLWDKVGLFVAESEPLAAALIEAGAAANRVRVVYPGVDLDTYRPVPPPPGRFRLLFASTPADPSHFDARGIPALCELARRNPDVDVVLLWRRWGDQDAARRALAALAPPSNVLVERRDGRPMMAVYHGVHAVACLYEKGYGKSTPNSIVEGLASGRPALLSESCGIARLVETSGAGVASAPDPDALDEALAALRAEYAACAPRARALAEHRFDIVAYRREYAAIYRTLARRNGIARRVLVSSS